MTPEEQKERQSYAIVAFNISVMVLMGALVYGLEWGFMAAAGIAFPLALVAAGVMWKVKSH